MHNWMKRDQDIIGNVDLRYVKMPGTHNSGAYTDKMDSCHTIPIKRQLELGFRSFELRLTMRDDKEYKKRRPCLSHRGWVSGPQDLEVNLQQIRLFCDANEGEFVSLGFNFCEPNPIDQAGIYESEAMIKHYLGDLLYLDTPENRNLFNRKFTLNSIFEKRGNTRTVVMTSFAPNFESGDPANADLYWRGVGYNNYVSAVNKKKLSPMSTKDLNRLAEHQINSTASRTVNDGMFLSGCWFHYADLSTTKSGATKIRDRFQHFINECWNAKADRASQARARQAARNTNYVIVDFAEETLPVQVADMNRQYRGELEAFRDGM